MRQSLKVGGYEPDEIQRLFTEDESFKVALRLFLVYQVALGYSARHLSRIYKISFKQITNWVHRFEDHGVEGLQDRPGRGRKAKLSKEALERIKLIVLTSAPSREGMEGERWTGPLLSRWLEQEYGIRYEKMQVYNILRKMGIKFKKGEGLVGV